MDFKNLSDDSKDRILVARKIAGRAVFEITVIKPIPKGK
jgi:hypothetical protein